MTRDPAAPQWHVKYDGVCGPPCPRPPAAARLTYKPRMDFAFNGGPVETQVIAATARACFGHPVDEACGEQP